MDTSIAWSVPGADEQTILGNSHAPETEPRGVVLLAHGFKGYKDYGMFPRLAMACADAAFIAHRFNFSHSGMTNAIETFERPDLFERDTWNNQVLDLMAVLEAVRRGTIAGAGLPLVMFGHSRGGVATLLTAGRLAGQADQLQPAGVVTAAAPSTCLSMSETDASRLLDDGYLESPSARTGQVLRIGRGFLQEQHDEPTGHDLIALVGEIACPILAVHGDRDPTVPAESAGQISEAARDGQALIIDDGDHVFNTSNPMAAAATPSIQLQQLLGALVAFARRVCP